MPTATELAINTSASALDLAQTIFGSSATVTGATLTGAAGATATYSGADATLGGIAPGDAGIILSTGQAADFTNSSGTADTNTAENGASTNNNAAGDADLNAVTGQTTFDAVVLETTFTTPNDYITMLFTFSSEEYLEYVNGGVNDAFGVWVNGSYVPFTPGASDLISIDTINNAVSSNLYVDNPVASDTYNTEMDGTTQVLSIKAPVNSTGTNTIRIALGDGGDGVYDSNVLIAADSVQTVALAFADTVTVEPNTATTVDVLANDIDVTNGGLVITQINGTDVVIGQTVTLPTGEQITLNPDMTLTVLSDGDVGAEPFTYMVQDSAGNTDVGYVTINTQADIPLNYIVEGTGGDDLIDLNYALDPQGDRIDASDALDGSNNDSIQAGAGNDTVLAETGNDTIDAGTGNDSVEAGLGNDSVIAGDGNDTVLGQGGDDTILGGEGADYLDGDSGNDSIDGGTGNDTIIGDDGNDTLVGGAGNDEIYVSTGNNQIEGGADNDLIFGGDMADKISGGTEMDTIDGGGGNDVIDGGADDDTLSGGAGNDTIFGGTGNDSVSGGDGADSIAGGADDDTLSGGAGNDSLSGGAGNDSLSAGDGDDTLSGGTGDDTLLGEGGDDLHILEDNFGNDLIDGGEATETGGDTLDLGNITSDLTIDLTGSNPENGTVSDGTSTATFANIETLTLGGGIDTIVLADGSGAAGVDGFAAPTQDSGGNWTGVDQLDVSGMTDLNGAIANTDDVTVTDTNGDGTGDAILTFPGGESITLNGVPAATFDDPEALAAIGIPMPNYIVEGTSGADTIDAGYLGDPQGDMVDASDNQTGTHDDSITAGAGNDVVNAGAGDDTVSGGTGADTLYGNAGDDSLFGDADDDLIYGGDGADTMDGGDGGDYLSGGADNDSLSGGAGGDDLDGGAGNDTIDGGTGNDNLDGGAGNDSLTGGIGNDSMYGDDGDDTLSAGAGNDAIYAGSGNDSVDAGAGTDYIQLTSGNDTVLGGDDGDNIDLLAGGYVDGAAVTVDGGTGGVDNDTLDLGAWTYYRNLTETQDADTDSTSGTVEVQDAAGNWITVTFAEIENLLLPAPLPNYIVEGTSGDDVINAGYTGDPEGDMIDANDAADGSNDDSVVAGAGNDNVNSGGGDDTVDGGTGNDTVLAGAGDDIVDGGAGNDLVFGFDGNDTVAGGDGADIINGMTGNDLLQGGADNDTFVTETSFGTDTIIGGEGTTTGTDDDFIRTNMSAASDPFTVTYTADEAGTMTSGTNSLTFSEIERIRLDGGNDTVVATATTTGINIDTQEGDDSVTGGAGADTVLAGTGNDTVFGGAGNDEIDGGAGNDTLTGGAGADDISGGDGDDVFEAAQGDTLSGGTGDDTFTLADLGESGAANLTIDGGEGDETGGDTLDLNGQADRTTLTFTNDDVNAGGLSGTVELLDGSVVSFANIENIICFVPGTLIATHAGLRKIEDLQVGERVMTQDNGMKRIAWIGKTTVKGRGKFAPVKFNKSVWQGATDDLVVSPQHRMLVKGYQAELLFGHSEVLVPALHMVDGKDVVVHEQESVTYIHIMFEQHEIIFANGIATESYHPSSFGVGGLADQTREELFALFPELRSNLGGYGDTARLALKAREAKVLAAYG